MLDRLFLSKLSGTGKVMYFVGQIVLVAIAAVVLFGALNMSLDDGQAPFIVCVIAIVVVWGLVCIGIWPRASSPQSV